MSVSEYLRTIKGFFDAVVVHYLNDTPHAHNRLSNAFHGASAGLAFQIVNRRLKRIIPISGELRVGQAMRICRATIEASNTRGGSYVRRLAEMFDEQYVLTRGNLAGFLIP